MVSPSLRETWYSWSGPQSAVSRLWFKRSNSHFQYVSKFKKNSYISILFFHLVNLYALCFFPLVFLFRYWVRSRELSELFLRVFWYGTFMDHDHLFPSYALRDIAPFLKEKSQKKIFISRYHFRDNEHLYYRMCLLWSEFTFSSLTHIRYCFSRSTPIWWTRSDVFCYPPSPVFHGWYTQKSRSVQNKKIEGLLLFFYPWNVALSMACSISFSSSVWISFMRIRSLKVSFFLLSSEASCRTIFHP